MTNKEHVIDFFAKSDDKVLAEYLIEAVDDDRHGVSYLCIDGSEWFLYDDAVDHTIDWLGGEAE